MRTLDKLYKGIEKSVMPMAIKLGNQRHLRAIKDAFISVLPITLMGGVAAVINSAPVTENTTNKILLAWANFANQNSNILNWGFTLTLGALSLYICIGITNFLCKTYKIDVFIPILLSVCGYFMLVVAPQELGFASKTVDIVYLDGKGLIPAMLIAIISTELYRIMNEKNFGSIKMPAGVPDSLTLTFKAMIPVSIIISLYILVYILMTEVFGTTLPEGILTIMSPALKAADSLFFTTIITVVTQLFWFFGIHDAALSGIMGPIRDGNLSINAAAHMAGEQLPHIFTTPFWVYFIAIGGCGAVLGLALLLIRSKSKQLSTVGKIGIVPALFGISEPIMFGVPLILNPLFFIPFIGAMTFNAVTTYLLMAGELIEKTFSMVSWNMPSMFGAFLSTMDIKAFIWIIALIIIDMLIYYPFFKVYERQLVEEEKAELVKN